MPPKRKAAASKSGSGDAAILVDPPYLYLGSCTSASTSFLFAHAITDVLSIGASPPSTVPNIKYRRLSLSYDPGSSIDQVVAEASDIIVAVATTLAGRVFVHCFAAVSRSPTVVAGYLLTRKSVPLKDALGRLVRARPAICPNPGFLAQLKDLELRTRGEASLDLSAFPAKKTDRVALFSEPGQS
ncbi:hypothetical protein HETIRDRAFT_330519 [Heterobasidion irregulare TC 32-1]|uniref:Uncharacterized protein n=1 Tax=Heterobasidion irregulare (strain TC 32-1) TaxID=747525 RepID=W4JR00_HETIT|nr:uncharacterized protein HETIRDRAFT_330519 [Heterobasidion irregulare TC 32-1]ETW75889.1 hypothetical protein HETIRDRAFT_330519 [Heterobasidion irregulare TC 32-1]